MTKRSENMPKLSRLKQLEADNEEHEMTIQSLQVDKRLLAKKLKVHRKDTKIINELSNDLPK